MITHVRPHAPGIPEAQMCARIGDALFDLTNAAVAEELVG